MVYRFPGTAVLAVALSLSAGAVLAAGPEPTPAAPVVVAPVPAPDWSGFYGGLTFSLARGDYGNGDFFPGDGEGDLDGVLAGVTLGYDHQQGNFVFGGEFTYSGSSNFEGSEECFNTTFDCGIEVERLATLRARLGYLVDPRTLVYGTAGIARAEANVFTDSNAIGKNGEEKTVRGSVFGIGLERLFTENVSVRGALLRYRFDEDDYETDVTYRDVDFNFNTLEIGVVYRF